MLHAVMNDVTGYFTLGSGEKAPWHAMRRGGQSNDGGPPSDRADP